MKVKKFYIETYGCQMNVADSEVVAAILEDKGYQRTQEKSEADVILVNTCSVREKAQEKVFSDLGRFNKTLRRKNPDLIIGVSGCVASQEGEAIVKRAPYVNIVFGPQTLHRLPDMIHEYEKTGDAQIDTSFPEIEKFDHLPPARVEMPTAYVSIMEGCSKFCSYCIVPYVRGRERSRAPEDIIREIEELVKNGVVEIMLLGQNVNSYGKNLESPITFAELLRRVERIEGLKRIRFMTSHPKDLSDELIEVMASSKKICRHLHLPLQSGSSEILKKMNRHYTKEQYLELAERIRKAVPDISLTTDIIVGFPGETEEDFEETLEVVRKVRYDSAFTFIYSKRTGTPAAAMENQVPEEVVKERFDRLLAEVQAISAQVCGRDVHTVQEVLVEEPDSHVEGLVTGRMSNNTIVHFPGGKELIGKIVKVYLKESKGFYYMGSLVD